MVNTKRNSPPSSTPSPSPSRNPSAASNPAPATGQPANAHIPQREHLPEHEAETLPNIVEASVKGKDEPMEREHPKAPGALIWFSYPLALLIVLLIIAVVFMWWNS